MWERCDERIRLDRGNFSSLSLGYWLRMPIKKTLYCNIRCLKFFFLRFSYFVVILCRINEKWQRNCFRFLFSPFIEFTFASFVEKLLQIVEADRVHDTQSSMNEKRQMLCDFFLYQFNMKLLPLRIRNGEKKNRRNQFYTLNDWQIDKKLQWDFSY
jgi:hypothetical protein